MLAKVMLFAKPQPTSASRSTRVYSVLKPGHGIDTARTRMLMPAWARRPAAAPGDSQLSLLSEIHCKEHIQYRTHSIETTFSKRRQRVVLTK